MEEGDWGANGDGSHSGGGDTMMVRAVPRWVKVEESNKTFEDFLQIVDESGGLVTVPYLRGC